MVCAGVFALPLLTDGSFDLVMTDKAMPKLSGEQQAAAIHARTPGLPVILMTGFGVLMKAEADLPLHISAILSKPITEAALREVLAKVFSPQLADSRSPA